MASTFSFGFSGDDIDNDVEGSDHGIASTEQNNKLSDNNDANKMFPARRHRLGDWTSTLPSQISYSTLNLDIRCSEEEKNKSKTLTIARREIFDVRTQLMAEDDDDHSELIASLEQGDLKPNFYEGGFKTWECALDLADVLLHSEKSGELSLGKDDDDDDDDELHVVELGCGTAVPSLTVFARLFSLPPRDREMEQKHRFGFTLADYNSTVLRLVTLSNFLLTWWVNSPASPRGQRESDQTEGEGELDIDPALLDAFQTDLSNRGIMLDFISGGWSAEFVQLVLNNPNLSSPTLVLASETIYAPSSLGVFSETLMELLRHAGLDDNKSHAATAFIAAKKVYFGVGGGVDDFLQVLYKQPLRDGERSVEVQERKEITSGGVKRVVLEVRIDTR